jgi:predicted DNA-binding protein YlxM (UPF0122 family)
MPTPVEKVNKRTSMIEAYKIHKETLSAITNAVDEIISGVPESTACLHNNLNIMEFRRLFNRNIFLPADKHANETVKSKYNDGYDWRETLMKDITGVDTYIADYWDESYEHIMSHFTVNEQTVMNLRYKEAMTYEEIGEKLNMSKQYIQQTQEKCIRKLRHPHWCSILLYGIDNSAKMNELENSMIETETRLNEYQAKLKQISMQLDELKTVYKNDLTNNIKEHCSTDTIHIDSAFHYSRLSEVSLYDMYLSTRTYNALHKIGIKTAADLLDMSYNDLLQVRNMGVKSTDEIIEKMQSLGVKDFARHDTFN